MSATTIPVKQGIYHKAGSLRSERRWALWTAYLSLIVSAVIMLAPPVYMLLTSLLVDFAIRSREDGMERVGVERCSR